MKKYEVVRQFSGNEDYYVIFSGEEEYCDDFGNPVRYDNYEEAQLECDELNENNQN